MCVFKISDVQNILISLIRDEELIADLKPKTQVII